MMMFDPMYILVIMIPGLIISLAASFYVKATFSKYSEVMTYRNMTGAEAAAKLLHYEGIDDVKIEETEGFLSDHYDPTSKTLRLSPNVYQSSSLSAIGVACHEAGHAIQHAKAYAPLHLRSVLVPATNICSFLSYFVLGGGLFLSKTMFLIGAGLFSVALLFAVVTLPVEWDASARAKRLMVDAGIVDVNEARISGTVLNAAFLTYVASAVTSLMTVLYFLFRSGIFGGGSSDE